MKRMELIAIAVGASMMVGSGAWASARLYFVELAQALPAQKQLVVDHGIWDCAGTTCRLISSPASAEKTVHTCRALHTLLGATVTGFGTEGDMFDANKLAACNAPG